MTSNFKTLTVENWLDPDEASTSFERLSFITGQRHALRGEDFAAAILSVELSSKVPDDIVGIFRVAQGTMLYGYFFYPLYALGEEQLWRVCEAALAARFKDMAGPNRARTFAARVEWMHGRGALTAEEHTWWGATRSLRNAASHPESQALSMPGEVVGDLRRSAHAVDCLFDRDLDFLSAWRR